MKAKKSILAVVALAIVVSMVFPLAACLVTEAKSVELDQAVVTVDIGKSVQLTALIEPRNTTFNAKWKSADETVATVDSSGKVTGVGKGTTKVQISAGGKSAECTVNVTDPSERVVDVTSITLVPSLLDLDTDNPVGTIVANVAPANASDKTLTWTSNNEAVATVQNGVVTAHKQGNAVITARAHNGITQTCAVRVAEGDYSQKDTTVHVTNVKLDKTELSLSVGDRGQLHATVEPSNATNKSVSWISDTDDVAEVDANGIVTAKKVGSANIIVTTVDGNKTAECVVTVSAVADDKVPVTGVTLDNSTLSLQAGNSSQLHATVQPSNATNQDVIWTSSDLSVATVVDGLVTAVGGGQATITVETSDGAKTAECVVTVTYAAPASVVLSSNAITLSSIGLTSKLVATVRPSVASQKVNWSSDNDSVATVVDGLVTATGFGNATITATTEDGGKSATCEVTVKLESDTLYVQTVSSLSNRSVDFIMGMDASAVPSLENAGVKYRNFAGQVQDVFEILRDNGITDIRIRVWNDPTDGNGHSYGGGNCDVDNAVAIAKRCKAAGLGVIIDFHYSDFWADPGKQTIPKAWKGYSTSQVATEIYNFTYESLTKIKATGVKITMVQVGNETNSGMAGSSDWSVISNYMNQGSKAVRAVTGTVENGGAKVAVHFTNPEAGNFKSRAQTLATYSVDYDVFGTSYYPYWHGTLTNLSNQLKTVHDSFGKEVMVLETSYAFTNEDFDGTGNTALDETPYPVTVQGQANSVRSVIETVANLGDYGLGVCYWEGTWIAASESTSGAVNAAICKQYGCGWATYYAHGYDSSAPASESAWGGCVIDNQAFFLSNGTPNESLKVFALVKNGNAVGLQVDSSDAQELYYTVNVGAIELPTTAWVTLNDGSYIEVGVTWFCTQDQLDAYIKTAGEYTIYGTTNDYGGEVKVVVWVLNPNLLTGGSFEADENITGYGSTDNFIQSSGLGDWKLDYNKATSALQLYVSTDSGNARMGDQSFHFWDNGTVDFTLYQMVDLSKLDTYGAGKYGCSFDIMGGDGVNMNIYAYIKVTYKDGTTATTVNGSKVELSGWQDWQRTASSVDISNLSNVQSIEVGIKVYAEVSGNGPWGNIDNAQFYFEG